MLQAQKLFSNHYATKNDLDRFYYTQSAGAFLWPKTELSNLATTWLTYFLLLARENYAGVDTFEAVLTNAQYRVKHLTKSARSTYRALRELEKAGLIRRFKYKRRRGILLQFEVALFNLLNKKAPKSSHNVGVITPLPTRQPYKCTSIKSVPNSPDLGVISTATRAINTTDKKEQKKTKPVHKHTPLIYSIRCAIAGKLREDATELVKAEISGRSPSRSGVDLNYWDVRFPELGIVQREIIARREIVPHIVEALTSDTPPTTTQAGDLDELVGTLTGERTAAPVDVPPDDPELALLWWAAKNGQQNREIFENHDF